MRFTDWPVVFLALRGLPSALQCVMPDGIPSVLWFTVLSAFPRRSGSRWRLTLLFGSPLPTAPSLGFSRGLALCSPLHAEWCSHLEAPSCREALPGPGVSPGLIPG